MSPKKLIILGAGASAELDYPTGGELILLFKRYLNQTQNIELLQYFNTEPISVDRLISHISNSEHRAKIKQILMFLISMCEKQWALKSTMYHNIISSLLVFKDDEWQLKNDVDILTFNYDVSLDIYCRDYIKQTICGEQNPSEQQREKAQELQNALRQKITHIYGSLWKKDLDYDYGKKLNEFYNISINYEATFEEINYDRLTNSSSNPKSKDVGAEEVITKIMSYYYNNISEESYFCKTIKIEKLDTQGIYYTLDIDRGFLPFRSKQQSIYDSQWKNFALKRLSHLQNLFENNNNYYFYKNIFKQCESITIDRYKQDLIQTIAYERGEKKDEYKEYKEKVKNADIIYIMGFGFDKFNCENVLGFDEIKNERLESKNQTSNLTQNTDDKNSNNNGFNEKSDKTINKKIFYTNYGDIPVVNRMVKYYFGDGKNVIKSTYGCSETMGMEFNFDTEI